MVSTTVSGRSDRLADLAQRLTDLGWQIAAATPRTAHAASALGVAALVAPAEAWHVVRSVSAAAASLAAPAYELQQAATQVGACWALLTAADAAVAERMTTLAEAAGVAAALFEPAGIPEVIQAGTTEVSAPHGLTDLLTALSAVSASADGQIEIQTLHAKNGPVHVVLLPGTDEAFTWPGRQDATVRDLGENLLLASGEGSSYAAGVLRALQMAGVGARDPVLLVGHSQGGMTAMAVAASGDVNVVGVVTAGSPIAGADPGPVPVLSLENSCDLVPTLDGGPNPATASWTTIRFTGPCTSVTANHGLPAYIDAAVAVEATNLAAVSHLLAALDDTGPLGRAEDYLLRFDR